MKADSHREIERKFLVTETPKNLRRYSAVLIRQGYLAVECDGHEVRLRHKGARFFLTVKRGAGADREEYEIAIKRRQFDALWPLTKGRRLRKRRYKIRWRRVVVEVDVYQERHKGLIVAEIEFRNATASRSFQPPAWLGREITGDPRFKNRSLAAQPAPPHEL